MKIGWEDAETTRITAFASLALLTSAAAAHDFDQAAYNASVLKHEACTETAAVELAKKNGEAYDLALEALNACKAEEAEIAKLAPPEIFQHVLGNVMYLRTRTILEQGTGPRPHCGTAGSYSGGTDGCGSGVSRALTGPP